MLVVRPSDKEMKIKFAFWSGTIVQPATKSAWCDEIASAASSAGSGNTASATQTIDGRNAALREPEYAENLQRLSFAEPVKAVFGAKCVFEFPNAELFLISEIILAPESGIAAQAAKRDLSDFCKCTSSFKPVDKVSRSASDRSEDAHGGAIVFQRHQQPKRDPYRCLWSA
jgi:hypothetical protein